LARLIKPLTALAKQEILMSELPLIHLKTVVMPDHVRQTSPNLDDASALWHGLPSPLALYGKNPYVELEVIAMTQSYEIPMSRIDARIPLAVRETIDHAAAMQGRTRTDFLIEAALEKAERVIAEQAIIRLTMRDQEILVKALQEEKTLEPTPFLKDLAAEYAARVEST